MVLNFFQFVKSSCIKFIGDRSGATMVEYGLIVGLISVAMILTLTSMTDNLSNVFTEISNGMTSASND